MQRLARAERDCVDLHAALAEALRRIAIANGLLGPARRIDCRDLADVLARIAEPGAVDRYIEVELSYASPAARLAEIEGARTPGGYAV